MHTKALALQIGVETINDQTMKFGKALGIPRSREPSIAKAESLCEYSIVYNVIFFRSPRASTSSRLRRRRSADPVPDAGHTERRRDVREAKRKVYVGRIKK